MKGRDRGKPRVDVATGEVTETVTDFCRGGLLPLAVERHYSSQDHLRRPYFRATGDDLPSGFGAGWRAGWDHSVRRALHGYIYARPNGQEVPLRTRRDGRALHAGHRIELEGIDARQVRIVEYECGRSPITYVFALASATTWLLESIEYHRSHRIDLTRDDTGRVIRLEHTRARCALVVSYANECIAYLELHTADGGRHFLVGYRYDARGLLIEVQDRMGRAAAYTYDANGIIVRVDKRGGAAFTLDYDREGRCKRIGGLDDYATRRFAYDATAHRTMVADAYGSCWTYDYDAGHRITLAVSPLGREVASEYDEDGLLERRIDPAGRETSYVYDEHGHLYCRTAPDGETFWEYDRWHRIVERFDERERIYAHYSNEHDLIAMDRSDGRWQFGYNLHGERASITNPLGHTKTILYDEFGNLAGESDFKGSFTHYEHDALGRRTKTIGPLGAAFEQVTDDLDRVVSSSRPGGSLSRVSYNGDSIITMGLSGAREALRQDVYGRTFERADDEGLVFRLYWGKEPEQVLAVMNSNGEHESFRFDADHRVDCASLPDERWIRLHRGPIGVSCIEVGASNPAHANGTARVDMELDWAGRLVRATSGGRQRFFQYDEGGRLIRAQTEDVSVERSYDVHGRCVDETVEVLAGASQDGASPARTHAIHLRREFDPLGRKSRIHCNGTTNISIGWDENSRVSTVMVGDTTVHYTRDATGAEIERRAQGMRIAVSRDPEGREVDWLYDIEGQPQARIRNSYDSRGFLSFANVAMPHGQKNVVVRCDGRGRIRALVEQGETRAGRFFDYDGEGQWLLCARSARGEELLRLVEQAGWDRAVVLLPHHADHVARATAHAGGRLDTARAGAVTVRYQWDALGRAVQKIVRTGDHDAVWQFEYDAWDALVQVTTPTGSSIRYRYDALGRCVERTSKGRITRLVWDESRLLHILVDGGLAETRVHAEDTGDILVQRFADGTFDVRPNRLRELEERLGGASTGSSLDPGSDIPRMGPLPSAETLALQSAFYDLEARVLVGLSQYCDFETGYHLTWQRGEHPFIPWPTSRANADDEPAPDSLLVRDMKESPESGDESQHGYLSRQARAWVRTL